MKVNTQFNTLEEAMDSIKLNSIHILIILLVAIGSMFNGIEQYIAGYAAPYLVEQWGISDAQVGLLTTFTFGGMAVGSLIAGVIGDIFGRRITFMYNLALFTLGAIVAALAPNIIILYMARFVIGLGLGGELNTGLTIVSESVPTKNRGASTATVSLSAGGVGIFLSAGLSYIILGPLSEFFGGETTAWRWLFGLLALPALLLFLYRFYLPETPRFLLSKGKINETNFVLSMFKSKTLIRRKVKTEEILKATATVVPKEKVNFKEIFSQDLAKRTIGVWIIAWMTFGAQVGITVFLPTVLTSQGFTIVNSLLYSTIINLGGLTGAILATLFAHKFGRKTVLIWGSLVAVIVSILFGLSNTTLLILIFGAFMQAMFMLLNVTTWLFAPENYPTRIRSFGTGAAVFVSLVSATVMPYIFGTVFSMWDTLGLYLVVAAMYVLLAIAALTLVVETKGKSLERIAS